MLVRNDQFRDSQALIDKEPQRRLTSRPYARLYNESGRPEGRLPTSFRYAAPLIFQRINVPEVILGLCVQGVKLESDGRGLDEVGE